MSPRTAAAIALFLGSAGSAGAVIGTLDDVPAATLLLPYFEVDPFDPNGTTTLLTIRNASAAPVVAHLTFWSNLSTPVFDFDVYLTGFDQQVFDLRQVLVEGILSTTGPSDALSPRGDLSGPHDDFGGSCSSTIGQAPAYSNPALTASFRAHVQAWLTGQQSPFVGNCAAAPTDNLVGYVTIDAANRCSLEFPTDFGYFEAGGTGVASNRNVLWGDWLLVDPANDFAHGDTLVHIEASADHPLTSTPGSYTFYGRYIFGGTAADNRERLPAEWNVPLDALVESEGTATLLVWRDSGLDTASGGFLCGTIPPEFPLGSEEASVLSGDGAATALPADTFPWETQLVDVPVSGSALHLDLGTSTGSLFDPDKQAHVIALRTGSSNFLSTGMNAVQGAGTGLVGAVDTAPGATLLLPYFEVDLDDADGVGTALAVRNASPDPVLTRVVLWTDLSVPSFGFEVHLPGFGSRTLDLRELFRTGALPVSGPAPLPGCAGRLPPAPLTAGNLAALGAAHTGAPSDLFGGLCGGADHGDLVARGYLTVDVVTRCTDALPGDDGYFGDGGAVAFDNALWGEYVLVEPANNLAHGDALVHLQASTIDPLTSTPGLPTFYGRFVGGTAADHREALPRRWGTPLRRAAVFDPGTDLLVWRDTGIVQGPFACGAAPPPFPLEQAKSLQFDETGADEPIPPAAFGLEAQRRPVDWLGPGFGWLSLDLAATPGGLFEPLLQAHVTSFDRALGRFATSASGVQLPVFGNAVEIVIVTVVASDPEAVESPLDPGELVVARTGPLDAPLQVMLSLGGTATPGVDYQDLGPLLLQIPAGQASVTLPVTPIADGEDEGEETVVLTLVTAPGATISRPQSATVTIRDTPEVGEPPQPPSGEVEIPVLNHYVLGLLALLLGGAGVIALRRIT
jgi:hypothetical protein